MSFGRITSVTLFNKKGFFNQYLCTVREIETLLGFILWFYKIGHLIFARKQNLGYVTTDLLENPLQ